MSYSHAAPSSSLAGSPSDDVPEVLATGNSGISTLFVSMSQRHPHGHDSEYLRWHTLDHRPEQYRLASIKASLRLISTPACRAVRAVSSPRFDATDHIMTYFFTNIAGLEEFKDLAEALRNAGRLPYLLPSVQHGVFSVEDKLAAKRVKVGADVLPWWPAKGVYILIEEDGAMPNNLIDTPGIAGLWYAKLTPNPLSNAEGEQQITYLFLDSDPVKIGEQLRPLLKQRWENTGTKPLFAAPFFTLVPHEWDRYLP